MMVFGDNSADKPTLANLLEHHQATSLLQNFSQQKTPFHPILSISESKLF